MTKMNLSSKADVCLFMQISKIGVQKWKKNFFKEKDFSATYYFHLDRNHQQLLAPSR